MDVLRLFMIVRVTGESQASSSLGVKPGNRDTLEQRSHWRKRFGFLNRQQSFTNCFSWMCHSYYSKVYKD